MNTKIKVPSEVLNDARTFAKFWFETRQSNNELLININTFLLDYDEIYKYNIMDSNIDDYYLFTGCKRISLKDAFQEYVSNLLSK